MGEEKPVSPAPVDPQTLAELAKIADVVTQAKLIDMMPWDAVPTEDCDVVLYALPSLLSEVRALRAERENLKVAFEQQSEHVKTLMAELAALRAEREGLLKDKERLDWLEQLGPTKRLWYATIWWHYEAGQDMPRPVHSISINSVGSSYKKYGDGANLREAIDAARLPTGIPAFPNVVGDAARAGEETPHE